MDEGGEANGTGMSKGGKEGDGHMQDSLNGDVVDKIQQMPTQLFRVYLGRNLWNQSGNTN